MKNKGSGMKTTTKKPMSKLARLMLTGSVVAAGLVAPVAIVESASALNVCTVVAKEYTSAQKWAYCAPFFQYNKSPRCYGDVVKCVR